MEKFRFIDHTSDLGVEVFGESLAALFVHAGEAFTDIVTDAETIRSNESRHISLEADSTEDLLVRWLNEFVYLFDTKGLLLKTFEIASVDDNHIEATVRGETYDRDRHPIKTTVKSATYHQLQVIHEGESWRARIIFDL